MTKVMDTKTTYPKGLLCHLGTLTRSDGSAEFTCNDTTVVVSVNGPMEIKMSKESIERATIELLFKQKSGLPSCAERFIENSLRSVCETVIITEDHPRSSITIVAQEIHNNGCFLAACINALSMALLDASVPMSSTLVASSCVMHSDGNILVKPTKEQEAESEAQFTLVFDTKNWEISSSHCKGRFNKDDYMKALAKCREDSKIVDQFMKSVIEKKFEKYI